MHIHSNVNTQIALYTHKINKSMLLYNLNIWGLSIDGEKALDSFHIKQLRKIIGVQYRTKMRNGKKLLSHSDIIKKQGKV